MNQTAPYASMPIPLFLGSTTGMKYRMLNCLECGRPFLERQNEVLYRVNDASNPSEIIIATESSIQVFCGDCHQEYQVIVSEHVVYTKDAIPLYMQPQSLYIVSEPKKRLRFIHCLECGHAFHSISDRIDSMSDNRVPFEFVAAERLGPIETMCHFSKCSQAWSLMV